DPNTGARADVFDGCSMRPRVSPDGTWVALVRENGIGGRRREPKAEPRKVVEKDLKAVTRKDDLRQFMRSLPQAVGSREPTAEPKKDVEHALWVCGLDPKTEPRKVIDLDDSYSGAPPVWSPDGKQIIISCGRDAKPHWVFTTFRVNRDGTGREKLAVPPEDSV